MEQINSTNSDPSTVPAEFEVQSSLVRFETAMDHLATKLDQTNLKIQKAKHMAQLPKEKLMQLRDRVAVALEPARPYFLQAREASRQVVVEVKRNPRPFLMVAAGIFGTYLLLKGLQRRREKHFVYSDY